VSLSSRRAILAGAAALATVPAAGLAASNVSERNVGAGGMQLRLQLAVPKAAPPPGGFPLLVVLDGNAWFPVAASIAEARIEEVGPIVVMGVGYQGDLAFDPRRVRDLTPFAPQTPLDGPQAGVEVGGADAFAAAVIEGFLPLAAREAPLAPGRRGLFGHSLGGLFVLHLLFSRPNAFDAYIAASPSIWWHRPRLMADAQSFTLSSPHPRVLVTAGELEDVMGPADAAYVRETYTANPKAYGGETMAQALEASRVKMSRLHMSRNAREMAERLRERGLEVAFAQFAGESHMSAGPVAINRAIGFATGQA
jgi:predicted alpha/beta superfamily hydrolase